MSKALFCEIALTLISFTTIIFASHLKAIDQANEVRFYLFPNPNNFSDFDELEYLNRASIEKSRFSPHKKVILIVHGFTQNFQSDSPKVLVEAYLSNGAGETSNIIAVDWGKLSGYNRPIRLELIKHLEELPLYVEVTTNLKIVGKRIQEFIVFLEISFRLSGSQDFHLVGQSLGAHVCGNAGMFYKEATGSLLKRISGTDPAGPLFQFKPINRRLDATDANFVDIVHTNQLGFGFMGVLGHVDFFVNGGGPILQPGCELQVLKNPFCSHDTAPHYYAMSIANRTMEARQLDLYSWKTEIFGEYCQERARGSYGIKLNLPENEIPPASFIALNPNKMKTR